MEEKLNNEDFEVKRVDGTAALETDANKIKLKMVSFATVMEVQEEFIEREFIKANEKIRQAYDLKDDVAIEKAEKDFMNIVNLQEEFKNAKTRFMSVSKKALKLPEKNLIELASKGVTEYKDEKISMEEFNSAINETEKYANMFANIDSEAIKREVENVINSQAENIAGKVDAENFEGVVKLARDEVVANMDEKQNEVESGNIVPAEIEEESKITKEDLVDVFANPDLVKTDDGMIDDQPDFIEEKEEEPVKVEESDVFNSVEPVVEKTEEETKVELPVTSSVVPSVTEEEKPLSVSQDAFMPYDDSDIFKNVTWASPLDQEVVSTKEDDAKRNEEMPVKESKENDSIDFGNDQSMEELLNSLKDSNKELENKSQELTSSISSAKSQVAIATDAKKKAENEREEAKRKAEEVKNQVELFKSYMPKIQDERKKQAEQKRVIQEQENELKETTDKLTSLNNATDVYKQDTNKFNEEYEQYLAELKNLRSSLTGDSDNFDVDFGKGRSK